MVPISFVSYLLLAVLYFFIFITFYLCVCLQILMLQNESEIPIEELLARYGKVGFLV